MLGLEHVARSGLHAVANSLYRLGLKFPEVAHAVIKTPACVTALITDNHYILEYSRNNFRIVLCFGNKFSYLCQWL